MSDKQIQHLLDALGNQQRALRILSEGAKLNHLHAAEFARAVGNASSDLAKARAAEEDPTLALR
jgi:hypothetical protein